MRTNLVWMVGAVVLASAAPMASAQYAPQGNWYPPRPAYQQWPVYPHWRGQPTPMNYPQPAPAWTPPQSAQQQAESPIQQTAGWLPKFPFRIGKHAEEDTEACAPADQAMPAEEDCPAGSGMPVAEEPAPEMVPLHAAAPLPYPVTNVTRSFTQNIIFTDDCESGCRSGASIMFLQPYFERNTAFTTATGIGTSAPRTTLREFDYDTETTIQSWIGYQFNGGIGIRLRYFDLDQSANDIRASNSVQTLPDGTTTTNRISQAPELPDPRNFSSNSLFGSPGLVLTQGFGADQLRFFSDLKIKMADIELAREMDFGTFTVVMTGGGRFGQVKQSYRATQSNRAVVAADPNLGTPGGTLIESESVEFNQSYNGLGPTVSLQAHAGICGSGFALFGSARGSLLAGITRGRFTSTQDLIDPSGLLGGNISGSDSSEIRNKDMLPIGEMEVGLEYGKDCNEVILFSRVAVVHQIYWGLGSASSTTGNLSLFGLEVSAGFGF